jgi:phosphohistidine phosphatase SixA
MQYGRFRALALLFAFWLTGFAQASTLSEQLKKPGYALLMRHALAPGVGDPAGFKLGDCSTQRNLDAEGRRQAVRIGAWLRQQGVVNALVLTSPWCRCKDTAALLGLGAPETESVLSSFFDQPEHAPDFLQGLQQRLVHLSQRKGDKALVLVTHHVNILGYMGENVGSGEMVLVHFDAQGRLLQAQRYASP